MAQVYQAQLRGKAVAVREFCYQLSDDEAARLVDLVAYLRRAAHPCLVRTLFWDSSLAISSIMQHTFAQGSARRTSLSAVPAAGTHSAHPCACL